MYWWIMLHVVRYPFEPLDDEKPQKLKRKLENSTKNSKLKGKTQKSAFFETPGARKAFKKEPWSKGNIDWYLNIL